MKIRNLLFALSLFACLFTFAGVALGQPGTGPPPGNGGRPCPNPPCGPPGNPDPPGQRVPISGVEVLLIAGAIFGAKKVAGFRKEH